MIRRRRRLSRFSRDTSSPKAKTMLGLLEDFVRVKDRSGRTIFFRSSHDLIRHRPFTRENLEAGRVLADALKETKADRYKFKKHFEHLGENLDFFIDKIAKNDGNIGIGTANEPGGLLETEQIQFKGELRQIEHDLRELYIRQHNSAARDPRRSTARDSKRGHTIRIDGRRAIIKSEPSPSVVVARSTTPSPKPWIVATRSRHSGRWSILDRAPTFAEADGLASSWARRFPSR